MVTVWGATLAFEITCGLRVARASRAAVTSLLSLAMTRQAASCWYSAWDSSCRAVCSCCLSVKLCNITESHSSCRHFNSAGMLVADGGLGFMSGLALTSINCSGLSAWLFIGSVPFSFINFNMSRFSNTNPDTGEITGCSGTSLLTT